MVPYSLRYEFSWRFRVICGAHSEAARVLAGDFVQMDTRNLQHFSLTYHLIELNQRRRTYLTKGTHLSYWETWKWLIFARVDGAAALLWFVIKPYYYIILRINNNTRLLKTKTWFYYNWRALSNFISVYFPLGSNFKQTMVKDHCEITDAWN